MEKLLILKKVIFYLKKKNLIKIQDLIFLLKKKKGIFIEVKNVTLSRTKNIAEFPDAVTERGIKTFK